jgi:hypothetical protein
MRKRLRKKLLGPGPVLVVPRGRLNRHSARKARALSTYANWVVDKVIAEDAWPRWLPLLNIGAPSWYEPGEPLAR